MMGEVRSETEREVLGLDMEKWKTLARDFCVLFVCIILSFHHPFLYFYYL